MRMRCQGIWILTPMRGRTINAPAPTIISENSSAPTYPKNCRSVSDHILDRAAVGEVFNRASSDTMPKTISRMAMLSSTQPGRSFNARPIWSGSRLMWRGATGCSCEPLAVVTVWVRFTSLTGVWLVVFGVVPGRALIGGRGSGLGAALGSALGMERGAGVLGVAGFGAPGFAAGFLSLGLVPNLVSAIVQFSFYACPDVQL